MKKTLFSIVLGVALLAASGVAFADQNRPAEPRWGIRPERSAPVSPLDLARWLARRLTDVVSVPFPTPWAPSPSPTSAPVTAPAPNDGDEVCVPERGHCPVG